MKNYYLSLILVLGAALAWTGCSSSSSPSSPSSPAPTATPTATLTPIPGIYWQSASIYNFNGIGNYANLNMTLNGQAVTNALVVITGSAMTSAVTVGYSATTLIGGVTYANYFSSSTTINYTPGSNYTLHTVAGGVTAACTMIAPGNITIAPDGSQASWTVAGNTDTVWVAQGATTLFTSGLVASPFSIPASVYATPGIYTVWAETNYGTGGGTTVTGAAAGSSMTVYDLVSQSVVIGTPTPTPTNSFTRTNTPTATNTSTHTLTPTNTFTHTFSPTVTNTPTITDTPTNTGTPTFTFTPTQTATPPARPVTVTYPYGSNGLPQLTDIRYDGNGNLWTTDTNNEALQKWTTAGVGPSVYVTIFNGSATFYTPSGLAIDPAHGNVYVADFNNNQFEVFNNSGTYLNTFGTAQMLGHAAGVAVNAAGTTVYGLDLGIDVIRAYAIGGSPSSPTYSQAATFGGNYLNTPSYMAFDNSGNLWVVDSGSVEVVEINPSTGAKTGAVTIVGSHPTNDLAFDGSGNLFITSSLDGISQEYDPSGNLINQWSGGYSGLALAPGYLYAVTGGGADVYGIQIQ